jgi:hypothetical protein
MKSCPSCRQVYPNDGPDFCTNDGTPLVSSSSEYGSGSTGYGWQSGGGQYPPPPAGWQPPPQNWGQPPPGQYAPYGYQMPYPPSQGGGGGLATAALFTGIGTIAALLLGFALILSTARSYNYNLGLLQFGGILILLSLISGLTALILGIVAVSMSNRNPAISKAKGIVGLCLGAIPLLLMIVGLVARMR